MSDQPAGNPSFDATIPGFTNALARLSSVAASAGYRVVAVTVAPHPAAQTSRTRPPPVTVTITSQAPPFSPRSPPPTSAPLVSTSIARPAAIPVPPATTTSTTQQLHAIASSRPIGTGTFRSIDRSRAGQTSLKRHSEASVSSLSASHPYSLKRTRLSFSPTHRSSPVLPHLTQSQTLTDQPISEGIPQAAQPATAYWGTVLEDQPHLRPPRQLERQQQQELQRHPPLIGPSLRASSPPLAPASQSSTIERAKLQRTTTSAAETTTPFVRRVVTADVVRDTEECPPVLQHPLHARSSPASTMLRRTGHILSRISPFPAQKTFYPHPTQSPPTSHPAHPSIVPPNVVLPPFQQSLGMQQYFSSSSRSASASGISHAQPSPPPLSSSPEGMAGALPGVIVPHPPKRGRRPSAQSSAPGVPLFKCTFCDAEFRRKSDKTRHIRVVHEKSRPFTCDLCGKTFGEKSNMLKHRASVHDDIRTFRCAYCDAVFSQRANCDHHVRSVHDKKQAKYFCEQCGLPFTRKVLLHEHYADAHPQLLKAYRAYEAAAAGAEAVEAAAVAAAAAAERGEGRGRGVGIGAFPRDISIDPLYTSGALEPMAQYGVGSSQQHEQAARIAEIQRREMNISREREEEGTGEGDVEEEEDDAAMIRRGFGGGREEEQAPEEEEDEDVIRPVYPIRRAGAERRRRGGEEGRPTPLGFPAREQWRYRPSEVVLSPRRGLDSRVATEVERIERVTAGSRGSSSGGGVRMHLSRFYEGGVVEHGHPSQVEQPFVSTLPQVDRPRRTMERLPPLAHLAIGRQTPPQSEDLADPRVRTSGQQAVVGIERQQQLPVRRDTNNKNAEDTARDPGGI